MSNYIEVIAIVEGKTEQIFIQSVLAPYLAHKMIFMTATQVSKPGQKGGDVRFRRIKNDLRIHLKQRPDTYVTTMVDFYGTKEWPGLESIAPNLTPDQIANYMTQETQTAVDDLFSEQQSHRRFIPYMAIHEFEALLFSDSETLAEALEIKEEEIIKILDECGEPEAINNSQQTAPSKRLNKLSKNGKFLKTTEGIALASKIGISTMRDMCPIFDTWISSFEDLVGDTA